MEEEAVRVFSCSVILGVKVQFICLMIHLASDFIVIFCQEWSLASYADYRILYVAQSLNNEFRTQICFKNLQNDAGKNPEIII